MSTNRGERMHRLVTELYPICRSITGEGLRATLHRISEEIPLELTEVPSGTRVFDWTVPDEWNVHDAWVRGPDGAKVVDFRDHNLHVVNYSVPVSRRLSLEELRPHLHSIPAQPNLIPYRTSYYSRGWGFCLEHRVAEGLAPGEYEVLIDSTLEPGSLTYGECVIEGDSSEEVLLSVHCCHPSLANDNLSGVAVATELAREIAQTKPRWTYRFLFLPATIGALAWLSENRDRAGAIRAGLVLAGVGDAGAVTYKRSRQGSAVVDRAVAHVLRHRANGEEVRPFVPFGYDERQYCSPGFDLPVGCLMRTPHGEYQEYHTSGDDLTFVRPESLEDTFGCLREIVEVLEHEARYQNVSPHGEPQLGRRGLYRTLGGEPTYPAIGVAMLWALSLSDGANGLLDIAERSGLPFGQVKEAAERLAAAGLLESVPVD